MKIAATLIATLSLAATANAAQFAPPPEVPYVSQPVGVTVVQPPRKTLGRGAAAKLTEEHERHYWHHWNVPLRFKPCYRQRANRVNCPVEAFLEVAATEAKKWNYYMDVVHLGDDDRAWISTFFPYPIRIELTQGDISAR